MSFLNENNLAVIKVELGDYMQFSFTFHVGFTLIYAWGNCAAVVQKLNHGRGVRELCQNAK